MIVWLVKMPCMNLIKSQSSVESSTGNLGGDTSHMCRTSVNTFHSALSVLFSARFARVKCCNSFISKGFYIFPKAKKLYDAKLDRLPRKLLAVADRLLLLAQIDFPLSDDAAVGMHFNFGLWLHLCTEICQCKCNLYMHKQLLGSRGHSYIHFLLNDCLFIDLCM